MGTSRTAAPKRKRIGRRVSRRTKVVLGSFAGAMTLVIGLLTLADGGLREGFRGGFLIATNIGAHGGVGKTSTVDPILQTDTPADPDRWEGIVIHHLGLPAADPERVHRLHLSYGYQGLGYHFLIGNGSGLGDGIVHVGYRWNQQLPGAHVVGDAGEYYNRKTIGICLIGNGDRRRFTEKQMRSLAALIRRLQVGFDLPAEAVHLHRDLVPGVTSPGRYFAAARLDDQLLD